METRPEQERERADPATGPEADAGLFVDPLLAGLAADDDGTAANAGCALALLAEEHPETAPDVVSPLVARLVDGGAGRPVCRTLATLVDAHGNRIREALRRAAGDDAAGRLYRRLRDTEGWDIPRELRSDGGARARDEFVRTFREVVRPETPHGGHTGRSVPVHERREDEGSADGADEDGVGHRDSHPADAAARTDTRPPSVRKRHERIRRVEQSETFLAIESRSCFDDLQVVAPESERVYANVVRTRALRKGREEGIAVRLYHREDGGGDGDGFASALAGQLRAWHGVTDDGVVSVADWGASPRPWVATEYVEETLARRDRLAPEAALAHAAKLTEALAALHNHGVVHGGLDPRSVVYAPSVLERRRQPMLDNVGLLPVYRRRFDPSSYLDPRYAAPEYFDSTYGRVDHATDIYQLGMVLYRVCTGQAPFDGSFEEVSRSVRKSRPPAPSSVADALPATLDEIIAKATAKQKLTRYETATRFHRDVCRLRDAV